MEQHDVTAFADKDPHESQRWFTWRFLDEGALLREAAV